LKGTWRKSQFFTFGEISSHGSNFWTGLGGSFFSLLVEIPSMVATYGLTQKDIEKIIFLHFW
jgi:hypothetical protein